jgi:uncharacterized membrane protein HdeD (DUF308 family)
MDKLASTRLGLPLTAVASKCNVYEVESKMSVNNFFREAEMDKQVMKVVGIVALVVCVVCLFVAVERYNTNAKNVKAMNQFQRSSPLGGMMGQMEMKPATPAATKYALFFAVIFGAGGVVLLVMSRKAASSQGELPA